MCQSLPPLYVSTSVVDVKTPLADFAVASIRGWWRVEGRHLYPRARRLLITADGGGSNGYRLRVWNLKLQKFADDTTLAIEVCHFPPGSSKWNKVEHRLLLPASDASIGSSTMANAGASVMLASPLDRSAISSSSHPGTARCVCGRSRTSRTITSPRCAPIGPTGRC